MTAAQRISSQDWFAWTCHLWGAGIKAAYQGVRNAGIVGGASTYETTQWSPSANSAGLIMTVLIWSFALGLFEELANKPFPTGSEVDETETRS